MKMLLNVSKKSSHCTLIPLSNHFLVTFIFRQDLVVKDTYIPPHAALELGILYADMGKLVEAKEWLLRAKNYHGFLVEVLIHMRIHAALREIGERENLAASDLSTVDHEEPVEMSAKAAPTPQSKSNFGMWIKSFV